MTIQVGAGTKLAKVEGSHVRDDGVRVSTVRPRYGKRYGKETIEVMADEILGRPPDTAF